MQLLILIWHSLRVFQFDTPSVNDLFTCKSIWFFFLGELGVGGYESQHERELDQDSWKEVF